MPIPDLLTKKLHQLTSSEVRTLKKIADEVFEPLTRPFRQKRSEEVFSFRKTVRRSAQQGGDLIPTYESKVREHRKSRLVIALSLSGIDRCAAVGLIPLFSQLQHFLDFKLLIYTDDIIPAKFTRDGFLENDIDLAWNNVVGPVVFDRLADMQFDRKEDTLLVIDNLGGGDSAWYTNWSDDQREAVQQEQAQYFLKDDKAHGFWIKLRAELAGNYDRIHTSSYAKGLKSWQTIVERNIKQRWVDAPAMMDYLVRWLFHPEFGRSSHAKHRIRGYNHNISTSMGKLKGKFKTVHWLRTVPHKENEYLLAQLLRMNVVDYMHEAETIEDFALVLSNIVHGRCTNKLSKDPIKFLEMIDEIDAPGEEGGVIEHDELTQGKEECFRRAITPKEWLPQALEFKTKHLARGEDVLKEGKIRWPNVDVSEWFPPDYTTLSADWGGVMNSLTPRFKVSPAMSRFSLLEEAEKVLREIKANKIYSQSGSLYQGPRKGMLEEAPSYDRHKTRRLEEHVKAYLALWSEDYLPYTNHLPLTNVLWCTGGVYKSEHLGYGIAYESPERWHSSLFHEHGHHFEHIVPEIAVFTNHLVARKVGRVDAKLIVPVKGGQAMPVTDGSAPWIQPYAGKWYPRVHPHLPCHTEIISLHSEYFRSPEALVPLMVHDPFMVKFMAFVFMGGPVSAMIGHQQNKEAEALESLQQRNIREMAYTSHRTRSSGGGGRGSRGGSAEKPAKKDRRNSFGV